MDRDWVLHVIETISGCSRGEKGITRLALSEEELKARGYVVGLMQEIGMKIRVDGIGNIIGRLEGTDAAAPPVIVGSHLDSVPEGGRYDGVLGVVGGLTAIRRIKETGHTKHPLELIIFTAEESSRFGFATMGSKAMSGAADIRAWSKAKDPQGVSFLEALTAAGLPADQIESASRVGEPIHAFVELHIEQGPVLEDEELEIGVVEAIAAPTRLKIKVEGTPGHSGTTPMDTREDALVTAAQIVIAPIVYGSGFFSGKVTVGRPKFFKAEDVLLYKSFIVEIFTNERMCDAEKESQIGSWSDRNPFVGNFCQFA